MCIRDRERLYLTTELPGWTVGVSAKTGHRAKVHVTDTGLCLLYTSDAADERSSVDLGGRRIIKKKTQVNRASIRNTCTRIDTNKTLEKTTD